MTSNKANITSTIGKYASCAYSTPKGVSYLFKKFAQKAFVGARSNIIKILDMDVCVIII